MWNEYRLKKVTVHICLMNQFNTTGATAFGEVTSNLVSGAVGIGTDNFVVSTNNALVLSAWTRQSSYGLPATFTAA